MEECYFSLQFYKKNLSSMGVFHVFKIVQLVHITQNV